LLLKIRAIPYFPEKAKYQRTQTTNILKEIQFSDRFYEQTEGLVRIIHKMRANHRFGFQCLENSEYILLCRKKILFLRSEVKE